MDRTQICQRCLREYPGDVSLISNKCRDPSRHSLKDRVWVKWNERTGQLEEAPPGRSATAPESLAQARPKPPIYLPKGKRFMLCDGGTRCRGERCTFPHSKEERDEWNRQLAIEQEHQSQPQPPPPMSTDHWPALQSTWSNPQADRTSLNRHHRQQSDIPPRFKSAVNSSNSLLSKSAPAGAIAVSELESAMLHEQEDKVHQQAKHVLRENASVPSKVGSDPLYAPLSSKNYKEKFEKLVQAERETHEGRLRSRCNGSYCLTHSYERCPQGLTIKNKRIAEQYKWFAYLDGLSIDNLSYVNLASESVTVSNNKSSFEADIYRPVHSNQLVVAFRIDCSQFLPDKCYVKVKFNLKQPYFDDLIDALRSLKSSFIRRLFPTQDSFRNPESPPDIKEFEPYFSEEQAGALRTISAAAPQSSPILLNGAFGTGKSRLLALSARFFQSTYSGGNPVRILVCTQQRVSADKFLDYYLHDSAEQKDGVFVIREYGYNQLSHLSPDRVNYYITSKAFQEKQRQRRSDNILLITTSLTALHLKFLGAGYFTHILIDECSQMREPEAIASLCLANANTKLVFAGDQNQVGPPLLVLGDVAQGNGLGKSLLQRLLQHYQHLGDIATRNIITLSRNYRCHSDILDLVDGLFYHCNLSYAENESLPLLHRDYKYPLVFICSDIGRGVSPNIYVNEAEIIADTVLKVSKGSPSGWPKPLMSNMFIVSPSEEQVARVNQIFRKKYPKSPFNSLPDVKSTGNIQGRECQAVFLSTTEEVHDDGSARNPIRSLCDPYVFNTAITRARSLVVAVGNPFFLLRMEQQVVRQHGKRGNCWSTFLKNCIQRGTLQLPTTLSESERKEVIQELQTSIEKLDPDVIISERDTVISERDAVISERDVAVSERDVAVSERDVAVSERDVAVSERNTALSECEQLREELRAAKSELQVRRSASMPYTVESFTQPSPAGRPTTVTVPHHRPTPVRVSQVQQPFASPVQPNAFIPNAPPSDTSSELRNIHQPDHDDGLQQHPLQPPSNAHPLAGFLQSPYIAHPESESSSISDSTNTDVQRVTPTPELASQDQRSRQYLLLQESQVDKKYHKNRILGSGGFGIVHHVTDKVTKVEYALKVILEGHKKRREVEALRKLKYPGIVEYIESYEEVSDWNKDGVPKMCLCIVMELCEKTLKNWLQSHGENSRNRKAMLNYFEQILDALRFIHENSYIHRDLKPSNILFSRESGDKLKVGDFGLVSYDDTKDELQQPATGSSLRGAGTPAYMSPEQLDLARTEKLDAKTDMYALGIILFELHYLKKADNDKLEVFKNVKTGMFPPGFKDAMGEVSTVVEMLTHKNAAERPAARDVMTTKEFIEFKRLNEGAEHSFVPLL